MTGAASIHASAAAREGLGVLLLGPPGAGKSDLLLRLINHGYDLVADDQVSVRGLVVSAPPALAGLLEVRGLGIVRLPYVSASLILTVELGQGARMPDGKNYDDLDLPLIHVDAGAASAPLRVSLALDCLLGRVPMTAGAFA